MELKPHSKGAINKIEWKRIDPGHEAYASDGGKIQKHRLLEPQSARIRRPHQGTEMGRAPEGCHNTDKGHTCRHGSQKEQTRAEAATHVNATATVRTNRTSDKKR